MANNLTPWLPRTVVFQLFVHDMRVIAAYSAGRLPHHAMTAQDIRLGKESAARIANNAIHRMINHDRI